MPLASLFIKNEYEERTFEQQYQICYKKSKIRTKNSKFCILYWAKERAHGTNGPVVIMLLLLLLLLSTICFTLARKKNMYIANKLLNANKIG